MVQVRLITETNGSGFWSVVGRLVYITHMKLTYDENEDADDFNELRVYFDPNDWNIYEDGLIYTDRRWINTFYDELRLLGFSNEALNVLDYSEQGMQGKDYVSLDCGKEFIKEFRMLENIF